MKTLSYICNQNISLSCMKCNGTNECRSYLINGTCSSDASSFWAGVFFMCLIIIPFIFIVVQENILFSEESDVIKVLNNLDMWGISLLSLSLIASRVTI